MVGIVQGHDNSIKNTNYRNVLTPSQVSNSRSIRFTVASNIFINSVGSDMGLHSPSISKAYFLVDPAFIHVVFYRTRVRSLFTLVTNSLTHWLTHCRLVNLIDVTLACEDANSKLAEVVTVADVDDEDRLGNSLLQIWELGFGRKVKLLSRLWAQGLVKILKLKFRQELKLEFGQYFAADVLKK